jgi:hypothetical protein
VVFRSSPARGSRRPGTPGPFGIPEPVGPHVEMEFDGPGMGWTDVKADVLRTPSPSIKGGIGGTGPLDLVAASGELAFALNNSEFNSAGLLGYYSPGHANARPGFTFGIGVRYRWGDYTKFVGRISKIAPVAGKYGERKSQVLAVDWMDDAAQFRPVVATQIGQRADAVLLAVVASVPRQPRAMVLDVADSAFPFAFDNSKSETQPVLSEIQRICQSEFGRAYMIGSNEGGGILRFEKRTRRLTPLPVATFDGTKGLEAPLDRGDVKNRAKVTTHPRRVGATDTEILFELRNAPQVGAGQTLRLVGRYNDPADRASRVGGIDMKAPVPTTDYTMNTQANGSGADLTASFTVVVNYGGNSAEYLLTNNTLGLGYVTKLQARGRALLDYDPVDAWAVDETSIEQAGEQACALDMPYQQDMSVALSIAEFIVVTWTAPGSAGIEIRYMPRNDAEFNLAFRLEPGDAVVVLEEVTGINGTYFVQNVAIDMGEVASFTWELQRALVADYWRIGSSGFSELGVTTVLAPL